MDDAQPPADPLDALALDLAQAEMEAYGNADLAATLAERAPTGPRAAAGRALGAVRRLVDRALDRIVDQPLLVPTAADAEALMLEASRASSPGAGKTVAVAAVVLPRVQRLLLRRSATLAKMVPGGQMVAWSASAVALAVSARQGARELQVLGSYLVTRLRRLGLPADRTLVRWLTLSVYADPARRPDPGRAAPLAAITRGWAVRAWRGDKDAERHAQLRVAAIDRLDLVALTTEWVRAGKPLSAAG